MEHWHMRKNSVAVSPGQSVLAGTQIGSTGSSGNSTWPHLHFESQLGGGVYEPSAGPCRPGASNWVAQVPIRRETYVRSWTFSEHPFDEPGVALPWDQGTRTGSFVAGASQWTYFRVQFGNLPAQSTYRVRYVRPDGSVAMDLGDSWGNTDPYRDVWTWFRFNWPLDAVGTWDALLDINGVTVADPPFFVVASPSDVVDHPPNPIGASLDPPAPMSTDVVFCRVATSLYLRDPDYELVSYEYVWDVNGAIIRDVITAGLSDAIPRGFDQPGDTLTCTVTPRDDSASGPSTSASAVIQVPTGGRR